MAYDVNFVIHASLHDGEIARERMDCKVGLEEIEVSVHSLEAILKAKRRVSFEG